MKTVERKIKSIVKAHFPDIAYAYNDWSRVNYDIAYKDMYAKLPIIVYELETNGTLNYKNGHFRDNPNVYISFVDKADLDFDGEQTGTFSKKTFSKTFDLPAVQRMKNLMYRFITAVNQSGLFEHLPESIPYSVVYGKTDTNLTGVTINVTLKEKIGVACLELK